MTLTRRETHLLIVCGILLFIIAFIPQQVLNDNEVFYLIFIVFPLGLYLATDPERINKKSDNE